jgi:hypothetical protein
MGKGPVLAEPVCGTITLRRSPNGLSVYALDCLTGARKGKMTMTTAGAGVRFAIGEQDTVYYEVVAE